MVAGIHKGVVLSDLAFQLNDLLLGYPALKAFQQALEIVVFLIYQGNALLRLAELLMLLVDQFPHGVHVAAESVPFHDAELKQKRRKKRRLQAVSRKLYLPHD